MASTLRTKLRIAGSVLFAPGFFDAILGRFLWQGSALTPPAPLSRKRDEGGEDTEKRDSPLPLAGEGQGVRVFSTLTGALHIHSTYSDGAGDVPTVMAGAQEAGVDFVLLSDHNSMKPKFDNWEERYETGEPFLIIGTEVTVQGGKFLLALDVPGEWEPQKGRPAQESIDAILAQGGLPFISLPFDIKHPYEDWSATRYLGLEVVNLSTLARRHINFLSFFWLFALYKNVGAMAAIRALLTRPDAAMKRWDDLLEEGRPMVGLGSLDAHAQMKLFDGKKHPFPSYADSFRAVTTHVLIPEDAARAEGETRRNAVTEALANGRCYIVYDCLLSSPTRFHFSATNGIECAQMGDAITSGEGVTLTVKGLERTKSLVRLYYKGNVIAAGEDGLTCEVREPGVYRVEVYQYTGHIGPLYYGVRPVIFSNPIYLKP